MPPNYGTFPLAHCRVEADERGLDPGAGSAGHALGPGPGCACRCAPLALEPDVDPFARRPYAPAGAQPSGRCYRLALEPARPLLVNLRAILQRHDPDLLLTALG